MRFFTHPMPGTPRHIQLEEQNAALLAENEALKQQLEELQQDNAVLRLKVDAMARKLFGRSSEKLDAAQLQMVFEALQQEPLDADEAKKGSASGSGACVPEAEASTPAPKRQKRTLEQMIAGLPVHEVIVDPDEVKAQPEAWQYIGAEETRLIDYTPGRFSCQKIVRRKYVRRDARHLPYYRIEQRYARLGMPIPRQTLCAWSGMACQAVRLILEAVKKEVLADGYVQIDEPRTPWAT